MSSHGEMKSADVANRLGTTCWNANGRLAALKEAGHVTRRRSMNRNRRPMWLWKWREE